MQITVLAKRLRVTRGSFYWHFRDRQELLDALLEYWEREMTGSAVEAASAFEGTPSDRILGLMEFVTTRNLARYDLAIWHWAQTDSKARRVFRRTIKNRFAFSARLFEQAGFPKKQAEVRGRMMVTYMMAESTLVPDTVANRKKALKLQHAVLTAPVN